MRHSKKKLLHKRASLMQPSGATLAIMMWLLLAAGWLYLAWLPVRVESQGYLAGGVLLALVLLKRPAQRHTVLRLAFLSLAAFLTARYFIWRATQTLTYYDFISFTAALLLFAAELYGGAIYALGLLINLLPLRRKSVPLPADPAQLPTVDVFIPSYNEDPAILETTLLAALNMRYPADKVRVCLLDDGGTEQKQNDPNPDKAAEARNRNATLKAMCNELGAHYITRARNLSAKAGNINSALQQTHGDLIVIFDADHVPTVDFLERTVGSFVQNPRLFLVQTPHFFINPDPVEHNLQIFGQIPSENEMFYAVIQHGLDFWESSFFCGSAAVLRRVALMEVGGIAGQSITEDAETALELHARGWASAYIDRPMIAGLQPESYSGFIVQRVRWAQGMLQILLLKNPLSQKGLRWWQRLAYFNSAFFWFFPFARVAFLLAPAAYLIFGLRIYNANLQQFLAYALPHVAAAVIASDFLFGRVRWAFVSELYELAQSLYSLSGLLRVIKSPRSPSFLVTPKGEQRDEDFVSELSRPFYLLYLLALASLAFGAWRYFAHPLERDTVIITMAWELFNLVLLNGVMGVLLERKQRRQSPRMPAYERASLHVIGQPPLSCSIADISASGVKLDFSPRDIPWPEGDAVLQVRARALGQDILLHLHPQARMSHSIGFRFVPRTLAERRQAVALAFGDSERWMRFRQGRETLSKSIIQSFWSLVALGSRGALSHLDVIAREGMLMLKRSVLDCGLRVFRWLAAWLRHLWRWATDRKCFDDARKSV
jgi:cellulose synthase (UDP-forming)